jgi:hypothetical protein
MKRLFILIVMTILLPTVAKAQYDQCYDLYGVSTMDEYFTIADSILGEDVPANFNESLWALAAEGGPCYLKRSPNIIAVKLGRIADWQIYRDQRTTGQVQPIVINEDDCDALYNFTDSTEFTRYIGNTFANVNTAQGAAGTLWNMTMMDWSPCTDVAPDVVARNLGVVAEFDVVVGMMTAEEVAVVQPVSEETSVLPIQNNITESASFLSPLQSVNSIDLAIISIIIGAGLFFIFRHTGIKDRFIRKPDPVVEDDGDIWSAIEHDYDITAVPEPTVKKTSVLDETLKAINSFEYENDTFEPNPNLPQQMNDEAEIIDELFDLEWGIGFYFDMEHSTATNDFWLLALSQSEFDPSDKLKRREKDIKAYIGDIELALSTQRDTDGLPKSVSVELIRDGRLYLQISRPDRQITQFADVVDEVLDDLQINMLHFGSIYSGTEKRDIRIDLTSASSWSTAIIGGSGSGKSVALKIALITFLLRNTPDDVDVYLAEHDPKSELKYFTDCPHVKGYATTQAGYLSMLGEMNSYFKTGDKGKRVLLISDEHPQFIRDDSQLGPTINSELIAMGRIYRSFGFNPVFLSQSGRVETFPGDLRANICCTLVGSTRDAQVTQTNFDIDFDISILDGEGDFLFCNGREEQRFKTPFINIVDDGADPDSEDRYWINQIVDRHGQNTDCTMFDEIAAEQNAIVDEQFTVSIATEDLPVDDTRFEYWQNIIDSGVDLGKLWNFDTEWFQDRMKTKAITIATGSPKSNNAYYGQQVADTILWAIDCGYVTI